MMYTILLLHLYCQHHHHQHDEILAVQIVCDGRDDDDGVAVLCM